VLVVSKIVLEARERAQAQAARPAVDSRLEHVEALRDYEARLATPRA
jgi:hypothetical protein